MNVKIDSIGYNVLNKLRVQQFLSNHNYNTLLAIYSYQMDRSRTNENDK
jgi:hypothetical protein